ncbi:hypothetical protein M1328_03650 [Patescibacteria group bacterium]|nr:hypothetical protein [Patescibacteria group bacterium]
MIGLSLGFILETELAFGLFLIPAFVIVYLLFKKLKDFPYFLIGLIVPSIPRLLFEAKNNFLQTRSLITQLTSAKETHPLQFSAAVVERTRSFWQYWTGIFYHQELFISVAFLVFLVIAIFFIKKSSTTKKTLFAFLAILLVIVYAFSILYKNNFFWSYYLDGIQYIFLFLLVSGFHFLEKNKKTTWLPVGCLIIVIGINLFVFFKNATNKNKVPLLGLRADNQIINYLVDASKHQYFCLNIYTPPVIPYTYMYLLSYYADQGKIIYPKEDFVNNQCYFLIDQDEYQFRVDQWREKNIPAEAEKEKTIKFQNGSVIELWTKK